MTTAAPLHTIADLQPGNHWCCLYETDEQHRAVITPFLRQGLEQGQKVLYIVDARTAEVVFKYLQDDGLEVEPFLTREQLRILSYDTTYLRGGTFDPDRMVALLHAETEQALAEGYPALRVTGEMTWALRGLPGSERLIEYEARLNEFFPGSQCLAICQYDMRRFDPAILLDVLRIHPQAVIGTEVHENFYYIPPTDMLRGMQPATMLRHWLEHLTARRQVDKELEQHRAHLADSVAARTAELTRVNAQLEQEIVERKQIEEALRNSEEKYRTVVENLNDAVFTVDTGGYFTYMSPAIERMSHYTADEFVGRPFSQYVHPNDLPRLAANVERALTGQPGSDEFRAFDKDGQTHWMRTSSRPVFEDGQVVGLTGVMTDITERKHAEEVLQQSEFKFRNIVENSQDGIILIDEQGNIIEWNKGQERITGFSRAEVLGRPMWDVQFQATPEEQKNPETYEQLKTFIMQLLRSGQASQMGHFQEWSIPRRDGTHKTIQTFVFPVKTDHGFMLGSIARDITEQKQAEEALQRRNRDLASFNRVGQTLTATLDVPRVLEQVLRSVTEIVGAEGSSIWLWDRERPGWLICRGASPPDQAAQLLNMRLSPGQGIAGWVAKSAQPAIVPHAYDDPRLAFTVDTQTGFRTSSMIAVPLMARDTVIGVLEVVNKLTGQLDTNDCAVVETLAAWAAIAIDNAHLVETLRQHTLELQAHNEELDAYAHTVAHDLKNPLNLIAGYADVLEEDYAVLPDEERQHCLRVIRQYAYKMSNIVAELLLLAEVRKTDVELKPLDMDSIIDEAQQRLADMLKAYKANIVVPATWPQALGYAPWVEEAWVNYISNAIKYGGQPPRVWLGANVQSDGMVRFWVRDNGTGVPEEQQIRLFTPFTRLAQARATGHGLGLSIVQRIVEKLGGQVGVESQAGQGSLFSFTLQGGRVANEDMRRNS
jgi:PAS domain S-box-containing protein